MKVIISYAPHINIFFKVKCFKNYSLASKKLHLEYCHQELSFDASFARSKFMKRDYNDFITIFTPLLRDSE